MADSIGTFSAKHTGNTYSTSADGELVIRAHFEGGSDAYGDGFSSQVPDGLCPWDLHDANS